MKIDFSKIIPPNRPFGSLYKRLHPRFILQKLKTFGFSSIKLPKHVRRPFVLGHMPAKGCFSGWGGQAPWWPPYCIQNYWSYVKMTIINLVQNHHITNIGTTLEVHKIKIEKVRETF